MSLSKKLTELLPKCLLISSSKEELFKIDYILVSNNIYCESFSKYILDTLDTNFNDKLIIILYKFILNIVNFETLEIIDSLDISLEIKEKISVDISSIIHVNYKNGLIFYECTKRNYMILMKRFNYIPEKYKSKITKWFLNELTYNESLAKIS